MVKKVGHTLVTGATGFLGKHVVDALHWSGYRDVRGIGSSDVDLLNKGAVLEFFANHKIEKVIHLAATVGGIGANRANPGRFFYENMTMGMNVIDAARLFGVDRFVLLSTVCSYPKFTTIPFKERFIWDGYPEETNAPYGIAKKALMEMVNAYRKEYEFSGITLVPVNLYGPEDNFDLTTGHVIPAIIRKIHIAQQEGNAQVTLWGSGKPTREFLYAPECARAIVLALRRYDEDLPLNLGSGQEISIADLAKKIAEIMEYHGCFVWDTKEPDGQPRRCLDITRAKREIGFENEVSLDFGLQQTITWFKNNYD